MLIVVLLLHFSWLTLPSDSFQLALKRFKLSKNALSPLNDIHGFYNSLNRDISMKMITSSSNNIAASEEMKSKEILHIELNDELKTSFMSYAMSTILSRALPDAVFCFHVT